MIKIAVFASGNGTNAENIIKYFQNHPKITVDLVASNNLEANVLKRARKHSISILPFIPSELKNGKVMEHLKKQEISFIVLAGFLLKIPTNLISAYQNKIINIHPSLLPLYGGRGMYGIHVHKKVFEERNTETGITIHFVNEDYDDGAIIFQAKCSINKYDSVKEIANKVHKLEKKFFPKIIESILDEQN